MINKEAGIIRNFKRAEVSYQRGEAARKAFSKYIKASDDYSIGGKELKEIQASMLRSSDKFSRNKKLTENIDKKSISSKIKKGLSSAHNYLKKSFKNSERSQLQGNLSPSLARA